MKTLFYAICCVGLLWPSGLRAAEDDESMNRFVSSLLKKMTLEEKIGQLSQCAGGFATGDRKSTRLNSSHLRIAFAVVGV